MWTNMMLTVALLFLCASMLVDANCVQGPPNAAGVCPVGCVPCTKAVGTIFLCVETTSSCPRDTAAQADAGTLSAALTATNRQVNRAIMKQAAFRLVQAAFSGMVWAAVGGVASLSILATGPAAPFIVLSATVLFLAYAKVETYQNKELEAQVKELQDEVQAFLSTLDTGESESKQQAREETPSEKSQREALLGKASELIATMGSAANVMFVADSILSISAAASMTTGAIGLEKLAGSVIENADKAKGATQLTLDTYCVIDYLRDNIGDMVPLFGKSKTSVEMESIIVTEVTNLDDLRESVVMDDMIAEDKTKYGSLDDVWNNVVSKKTQDLDGTSLVDGIYSTAVGGLASAVRPRSSAVTSNLHPTEEEMEEISSLDEANTGIRARLIDGSDEAKEAKIDAMLVSYRVNLLADRTFLGKNLVRKIDEMKSTIVTPRRTTLPAISPSPRPVTPTSVLDIDGATASRRASVRFRAKQHSLRPVE